MRVMGMPMESWLPSDNILVAKAIAWDMNKLWEKKLAAAKIISIKGEGSIQQYYPSLSLGIPSCSSQDLVRQDLPYSEKKVSFPADPRVPPAVIEKLEEFSVFNHKIISGMGEEIS